MKLDELPPFKESIHKIYKSISAISKTVAQQASGTMSENLDQDDDLNWKRRHKRRKKIRRKKRGM